MDDDELPPEIDLAFYRANNPDLAAFPDAPLLAHYRDHGRDEGRPASSAAKRAGFLEVVAREQGRILEVGPYCNPIISGNKVRYLDMAGTEALRKRAAADDLAPERVPRIHYVGTVDALPRSFDAAVACRSIGHHPDLIRHLQSIGRVLIEGGRYYLIVPDHRRSTSALPLSTEAAVIGAHREQRQVHSLESLITYRVLRLADDGQPVLQTRAKRIAAAIDEHEQARNYIDVEAWRFTPESFRDLTELLFQLGLSPLAPVRVWPTPSGRDEFCAVLEKPQR
ncbi:methyltransferase domain-containing protein [Sphingomonas radiodurans]|uniref:class I SAM-dependent methyltransferase n=1 Tax=Sphingomonas radiodurans TaxID=2890321 RepID=UPI001E42FF81|nr:class I SAM-dependent methyltransferase [Sphingomonas radiodurans]WBH16837.1 class I SAM-dependent methyltransferase [Sphingomonas radiodurans]